MMRKAKATLTRRSQRNETPKFVEVSFDVDKTLFRQPALTQAARGLGIGKKWDAIDEMYQRNGLL